MASIVISDSDSEGESFQPFSLQTREGTGCSSPVLAAKNITSDPTESEQRIERGRKRKKSEEEQVSLSIVCRERLHCSKLFKETSPRR